MADDVVWKEFVHRLQVATSFSFGAARTSARPRLINELEDRSVLLAGRLLRRVVCFKVSRFRAEVRLLYFDILLDVYDLEMNVGTILFISLALRSQRRGSLNERSWDGGTKLSSTCCSQQVLTRKKGLW